MVSVQMQSIRFLFEERKCAVMYKLCITEKSAKNQLVLEQAFLRLALQHNYDDVTISDICREAGLSRVDIWGQIVTFPRITREQNGPCCP